MDWMDIIAALLTIALAYFGSRLRKVTKEVNEFFTILSNALKDGQITPAELAEIIKEAKDIGDAIRNIKMAS